MILSLKAVGSVGIWAGSVSEQHGARKAEAEVRSTGEADLGIFKQVVCCRWKLMLPKMVVSVQLLLCQLKV